MIFVMILIFVFGCSQTQSEGSGGSSPGAGPETPAVEVVSPQDDSLRRLRQVYLDTLGELPGIEVIEWVKSGDVSVESIFEQLIHDQRFSFRLAQRYRQSWGLSRSHFKFLASSSSTVDESFLTHMADGVLYHVGSILSKDLHPGFSFIGSQTVLNADFMNSLGLTGRAADTSGSYYWVDYHQNNAAWGVLSSPGFLGHFPEHHDEYSRMRDVLSRVFCLPLSTDHDFSALSSEEIFNIETTQQQNKACISCHRRSQGVTDALGGMLQTASPQGWWDVAGEWSGDGFYGGEEYSNREELNHALIKDPRLNSCGVRVVMASLLGRPLVLSEDKKLMEKVFQTLELKPYAQSFHDVYQAVSLKEPFFGNVDTNNNQGFRLLDRWQWDHMAKQLVGVDHAPLPPISLSPSLDERADREYQLPSGRYLRSLKTFVFQLAEKIVEIELADHVQVQSRKVFVMLPGGAGSSDSDEVIRLQIVSLWERMTGLQILTTDQTVDRLMSLGNNAAALSSDLSSDLSVQSRRRWVCILVGVFLSYEFIGV